MTLDAKLPVRKVNSVEFLQLESLPVGHTVETELFLSVKRQLETVTMEIKIHSMAAINAKLHLDGSAGIGKIREVMLLELQGLSQFALLHVEIINLTPI